VKSWYVTNQSDLNKGTSGHEIRPRFVSAQDYLAAAERRVSSAEAVQGLPIVIGKNDMCE
jgi:hypothetical protein